MTPYNADTLARIAGGPVEHIMRATYADAGQPARELPLLSSSITFDEGWHPRIQATVETDAELYDALDARAGVRARIEAGYVLPTGIEDVHLVADLGVRRTSLVRPEARASVSLASDEALVMDNVSWLGGVPSPFGVNEHASSIIAMTLPDASLSSVLPAGTLAAEVGQLTYGVGDPLWDNLPKLVTAAGAQIWVEGDRTWRIGWPSDGQGAARASLTVGAGGVVVESESVTSREDSEGWLNFLAVKVGEQTAFAAIGAGPYSWQNAGIKGELLDLGDGIWSYDAIAGYASRVLARRFTKGRQTVLTAPAMYWLRPNDVVTYRLRDGIERRAVVSRVTFTNPDGRMRLALRHPETGSIQTGE